MKRTALLTASLLALSSAAHAEPGAWNVKELGASADGAKKYFVAQVPSDGELVNTADARQKAELAVRCDAKGLFVTFLWPDFVEGETYDGSKIDVTWKVDDQAARQLRLRKVDKAAIALGKDGFKLLNTLSKGKTLVVRLPDMHGGQKASFPIDGIAALDARIKAQGCG
jgi:hypothetical protein